MSPDRLEFIVGILTGFGIGATTICFLSFLFTLSDLINFDVEVYLKNRQNRFDVFRLNLIGRYLLFAESSAAYRLFLSMLVCVILDFVVLYLINR
jgi:hypothetical protein